MTIFLKINCEPNIPILMYHQISMVNASKEGLLTTNPSYFLSIPKFRAQMEHIASNGFATLLLDDLINQTVPNPPNSVLITFDDGWYNTYSCAFPVLEELGFKATIFIITDFVGRLNYMSWNQLQQMNRKGISIQSHTATHRSLTTLKTDEIKYELAESKIAIENHLGTPVEFLSLPHGMANQMVVDLARSVGYKAICTSEPGFSHSYGNPAILKRINISNSYDISSFGKILKGKKFNIFPAVVSKKTKNLTKKLLGYSNYRKLYNLRYRSRTN